MKKFRAFALIAALLMFTIALAACGGKCDHKFENGVCTECGEADPEYNAPCTHESYSDGVCDECGEPCTHKRYREGICLSCGFVCTHSFAAGKCTVCGDGDPTWREPDGGLSLYAAVVSDFKDLIIYKYTNETLPPMKPTAPAYTDTLYEVAERFTPAIDMGWAYKDINGDGIIELLLMERHCRIHAMLTVKGSAVVTVHVFDNGMGYLHTDGTVFYNENGEAGTTRKHIKRLEGTKLVGLEYGREDHDGNIETSDDDTYYHIINGEKLDITKAEFVAYGEFYEYFWTYPTRMTRRVGLLYTPCLPATIIADTPTADFSSYAAIIKTFELMYNKLALGFGTGYQKTKWTGGAYETGMYFSSEEDYVLFNKLVEACVLIQNSSKAEFGYAFKDLNSDGAAELILLERDMYIHAIFTMVDNKPVLLDYYNDLRSAFIDSEGRIHVMEQPVPGVTKNREYHIYEIENGALVSTLTIGKTYTKPKYTYVESGWYKVISGVKVEIENGEWSTLYAQWAGDLGDTEFQVYTKNNAALSFVAVEIYDEEE